MTHQCRLVYYAVALIVAAGCRKDEITGSSGNTNTFSQELQFSATGVTGSSRTYSRVSAAYDVSTNEMTIETLDDSLTMGKFLMRFHGNMAGTYVYDVTGSASDLNQVYMRFVPNYSGHTPSAIFELTNVPGDSLQAVVVILHFGTVQDSVTGTFSGLLRLTNPSVNFKSLVHSGSFRAKRLQ